MKRINTLIVSTVLLSFLSGCGGGGGSSSSSQEEIIQTPTKTYTVSSIQEASSFLARATFGANKQDLQNLVNLNDYNTWIENQFEQAPTYHLQWAKSNAKGVNAIGDLKDNPNHWQTYSDALNTLQRDAWWDIIVNGKDQLRQRVAFALSEIMVISKYGALINYPDARMSYYDVLVKNAFGNFETLLQEVTYHPAMGIYLSYLGNAKADDQKGSYPDENYAREIMQLFSIGLYELNQDASKKTLNQKDIATYTQDDIQQMAKVFTGLSDQNNFFFVGHGSSTHFARTNPMVAFEQYHDKTQKTVLGKTLLANQTVKQDINLAIKHLFNHPNTAPFIAKRLIQRLVTSNPSPKYVEHVAAAFNSNEKGERGDLKAVIKAILLYKEDTTTNSYGKLKEPLLFVSNLFRAFNAQKATNILSQGSTNVYEYSSYNFNGTGYTQQEGALEALTVFNYFPSDAAPNSLKTQGLLAPEFELFGTGELHQLLMGLINKDSFIYDTFNITAELQIDDEKNLIQNQKYDELLEELNILLLGGNMSTTTKNAIKKYIDENKNLSSEVLARYVISLVITSPDFAIQR